MIDASRQPDFSFNLTSLAPANESNHSVDLVAFQEYNPCHFILQDLENTKSSNTSASGRNNNPVFSNIIAISVQNHSAGVGEPGAETNGYKWYKRRYVEEYGWTYTTYDMCKLGRSNIGWNEVVSISAQKEMPGKEPCASNDISHGLRE